MDVNTDVVKWLEKTRHVPYLTWLPMVLIHLITVAEMHIQWISVRAKIRYSCVARHMCVVPVNVVNSWQGQEVPPQICSCRFLTAQQELHLNGRAGCRTQKSASMRVGVSFSRVYGISKHVKTQIMSPHFERGKTLQRGFLLIAAVGVNS